MKTPKLSPWVRVPFILGALGAILWWESRRPLRRPVESKPRRISRNLAIAAVSVAALQVAGRPVVGPLTALVERRQWGLLKWVSLPRRVEVPLALVLLDYTLYIWHVLMHRVPWLWRFHVVHHVDLDLDTSTALRFHFGELTASVVWQVGQVVLLGVSPLAMSGRRRCSYPSYFTIPMCGCPSGLSGGWCASSSRRACMGFITRSCGRRQTPIGRAV